MICRANLKGRLLNPPEKTYRTFVHLLEQCQGRTLRELSHAVHDVIDSLFSGQFDLATRFAIDDVDRRLILRYPKGSNDLLAALSGTTFSDNASLQPSQGALLQS